MANVPAPKKSAQANQPAYVKRAGDLEQGPLTQALKLANAQGRECTAQWAARGIEAGQRFGLSPDKNGAKEMVDAVDKIKTDLIAKQKEAEQLTTELREGSTKFQQVLEGVEAQKLVVDELRAKLAEKEDQIVKMQPGDAKAGDDAQLKGELEAAKRELETTKNQHAEAERKLQEMARKMQLQSEELQKTANALTQAHKGNREKEEALAQGEIRIKALENDLAQKKAEILDLGNTITRQKELLAKDQEGLQKQTEQLETLNKEVQGLKTQLEQGVNELKANNTARQDLERRLNEKEQQKIELEKTKDFNYNEMVKNMQKASDLEKKIEPLNEQIRRLENQLGGLQDIETQFNQAKQVWDQAKVASEEERLRAQEKAQKEARELGERIGLLNTEINQLKATAQQKDVAFQELNQEATTKAQDLEALKRELDGEKAKVVQAGVDVGNLKQNVETLRQEIITKEEAAKGLANQAKVDADREIAALKQEVIEKNTKIEQQEQKIKADKVMLNEQAEELQKRAIAIGQLKQEVAKEKQDVVRLGEEVAAKMREIENTTRELDEANGHCECLGAKVDSLKAILNQRQRTVVSIKDEMFAIRAEMARCEERIEAKEVEIKAKKEALAAQQQALAAPGKIASQDELQAVGAEVLEVGKEERKLEEMVLQRNKLREQYEIHGDDLHVAEEALNQGDNERLAQLEREYADLLAWNKTVMGILNERQKHVFQLRQNLDHLNIENLRILGEKETKIAQMKDAFEAEKLRLGANPTPLELENLIHADLEIKQEEAAFAEMNIEAQKRFNALKNELEAAGRALVQAEADLKALPELIGALKKATTQNVEFENVSAQLKQMYENVSAEFSKTCQMYDTLVAGKNNKINEQQEQFQATQEQLAAANAQLAAVQAQLAAAQSAQTQRRSAAEMMAPIFGVAGAIGLGYAAFTNPAAVSQVATIFLREIGTEMTAGGLNEMVMGYGMQVATVVAGLVGHATSSRVGPYVAVTVMRIVNAIVSTLFAIPGAVVSFIKGLLVKAWEYRNAVLALIAVGIFVYNAEMFAEGRFQATLYYNDLMDMLADGPEVLSEYVAQQSANIPTYADVTAQISALLTAGYGFIAPRTAQMRAAIAGAYAGMPEVRAPLAAAWAKAPSVADMYAGAMRRFA